MSKEKILSNLESNIAIENFRKINKKHEKRKKILQSTLTVVISTLSVTGMVFAKDISKNIYNNFFFTGKGMETAINEGYIENTQMDYEKSNSKIENEETGEIIEDADTKVKVTEFVMDDFNLSMTFDVELSEKTKQLFEAENVWEFNFPDLLISDENDIVLYNMYGKGFDEFSQEKNLGYNFEQGLDNGKIIGSGVNIVPIERKGNHVKVVYNIYTGGDTTYPKSKKLNIRMKQIKVSTKESTIMGAEEITLTGNWNFNIDVPEKMYNRTNTIYTQKDTTNKDYKVTEAALYNTGLEVTIEVKTEKMPDRYVSKEMEFYKTLSDDDELKTLEIMNHISWKERKTEEYKKIQEKIQYLWNINSFVTNESGEKFEMSTDSPKGSGSKYINDEGTLIYKVSYNLTKFNQTDKIVIHTDYNGQKEEITLEKKEDK